MDSKIPNVNFTHKLYFDNLNESRHYVVKNLTLNKRGLAFALGSLEVISKPLECLAWLEGLCLGALGKPVTVCSRERALSHTTNGM